MPFCNPLKRRQIATRWRSTQLPAGRLALVVFALSICPTLTTVARAEDTQPASDLQARRRAEQTRLHRIQSEIEEIRAHLQQADTTAGSIVDATVIRSRSSGPSCDTISPMNSNSPWAGSTLRETAIPTTPARSDRPSRGVDAEAVETALWRRSDPFDHRSARVNLIGYARASRLGRLLSN